ncbi:MAG TPA: DNA helicase RecQ [bacterium]|nr:DNA helicase RecQ [bacterium]
MTSIDTVHTGERFTEKTYEVLKHRWGYDQFRPLQKEVIASVMAGRDSLTMLPTGGGKSLCFQLPALLQEGMAVVISPLISLMKDQVDSLVDMGVAAACLNSSLAAAERRSVVERIRSKELKLLYISPERLQVEHTQELLRSVPISFFVIDEAHCISHWGHDFREEYRCLHVIKERFRSANVHAFTATATAAVQRDIVEQLRLANPALHIGPVDRPNLTYRVRPRDQVLAQVREALDAHANEPGIIYCLRRDDVDRMSEKLNKLGYKNLPYHAGLSDGDRRRHQEAFAREEVDIIVATVAFGMGIDRSNIRFVVHAAMPKSIEHYHQETGRAGRDGLPSFCYLFYGGGDFMTLSSFMRGSSDDAVMMRKLQAMYDFCSNPRCRHRVLANYFDQPYERNSCDSCDYCLGELELADDPLIIAQKVLSCVARARQGVGREFGAAHIASVLIGKATEQVARWQHQELSTFGLMADQTVGYVRYMIEQLIGQGYLVRDGEFSTLGITASGWRVLRGETVPVLVKPLVAEKKKEIAKKKKARRQKDWEGADMRLFELLREKRAELAQEKGVPAYIVFGDRSLKDMASKKPVDRDAFAQVFGVGDAKLEAYADIFIDVIKRYAVADAG